MMRQIMHERVQDYETQLQQLTKQRPSCNSNWCWCAKNHSIPPRCPRLFIPRRRPRRPCPWRKHGPKKRRRQSLGAQTIAGENAHEQSHTTHATAKCVSHQAYNQYSIGGVDVPDRNQSHNHDDDDDDPVVAPTRSLVLAAHETSIRTPL